eukprot:sb/3471740/
MSSVTMFSECLTGPTVNALYRLGPGYKHAFKYGNEHDVPIPATDQNLIYNGKLANSTIFSYNPKACNGQLSFEVGYTEILMCINITTISCSSDLTPSLSLPDSTPELCSTLLWLFVDLVRSSAACQSYVVTNRTLGVIAHLLQKVDTRFLGEAALDSLLTLGSYDYSSHVPFTFVKGG